MKAELNTVKKMVLKEVEEKEVVLTLTETEAKHLRAIVGKISCGDLSDKDNIRHTTNKLYDELKRLGFEIDYKYTSQIDELKLKSTYK